MSLGPRGKDDRALGTEFTTSFDTRTMPSKKMAQGTADGFAVLTGSLTMPQKRPLASRNELMVFCHCAFSSVSLQRTPVLAPATSRLGPFFGRLRKSVEILSRDLHGVLSVSVPSSISI